MTTDELLTHMHTLLFFGGKWHARAIGPNVFSSGVTAREAMLKALGLSDEPVAEPNSDLF